MLPLFRHRPQTRNGVKTLSLPATADAASDPTHTHESAEPVSLLFREQAQRIHERELLSHPDRWPEHPFLCLTHRREVNDQSGIPREGLLYDGHPHCVFPINLFDVPRYGGTMKEAEFLQTKIPYDSLDSLLDDWQVD